MKHENFQVGDLVIMQHATYHHEYDGLPAVICGERGPRNVVDLRTMREFRVEKSYQVQLVGFDDIFAALPYQLRKPGNGTEIQGADSRRCPEQI